MKRYVDLDEILLALPKNCEKLIRDWPLADVEEARHGKWIQIAEHDYGYTAEYDYKCNLCNFHISFTDRSPIQERYYFCPNCGARMDKE